MRVDHTTKAIGCKWVYKVMVMAQLSIIKPDLWLVDLIRSLEQNMMRPVVLSFIWDPSGSLISKWLGTLSHGHTYCILNGTL